MPSSMTPVSDASLKKTPVALTPEQAKNCLAVIKQGTMTVQQYFEECHRLCNIINGKAVDVNTDYTLLAAFKNGLNDNIRKIINLAPITDAYTARQLALQEEMFADYASKRDENGDNDRIQKIQMRNFEQQLCDLNRKLDNTNFENKNLKEMVATLTESLKEVQKEQAETTADHFHKVLVEIKKMEDDNKATATALKEKVEEEMAQMRNTLDTMGRGVDMNYDWIGAIQKGVDDSCGNPAAAANAPILEAEMVETPNIIPTATAPPMFPTKRPSPNVVSDGEDEDEDRVPTFNNKRARTVTATEEDVLEEMKKVLSESELAAIHSEDVTNGITKLYNEYSSRTEEARRWMAPMKKVDKDCCLCGTRSHHAYDCDKVRTIEEREQVMRREWNFCVECANIHGGWCRGLTRDCRMCGSCGAVPPERRSTRPLVVSAAGAVFEGQGHC